MKNLLPKIKKSKLKLAKVDKKNKVNAQLLTRTRLLEGVANVSR